MKAPLEFEKYNRAVGGVLTEGIFKNIKESVEMLLASSIDYEFRTREENHNKIEEGNGGFIENFIAYLRWRTLHEHIL